jgi:predicted transcriptional regulator
MLAPEMILTIMEMRKSGGTLKGIARNLGISRNCVRKYIRILEGEGGSQISRIIETSTHLPRKQLSGLLLSYHNVGKGNDMGGSEMTAGKRVDSALSEYRKRYSEASKLEKGCILNEFCKLTKYHRKYAITLLKRERKESFNTKERKKVYSNESLLVVERIWEMADYPWSERLVAQIPLWLPWAKQHMKWITPQIEQEVQSISARQIDRRLKDKKKKLKRRMYGRTKPGTLLKHHIPIKTDSWNVTEPGYTEADLVSHSGSNASGVFIYSLSMTDILTGWVETVPIMGKSGAVSLKGIQEALSRFPFPIKGIDTDNGTEFINDLLFEYCKSHDIQFTRGRPYKKDDNAHIEQKNWTHVRKVLGYERFDSAEHLVAMRDLYRNKLRLMMNLFQPCVKLKQKKRIGSKIQRKYELPATPIDRLVSHFNKQKLSIPSSIKRLLELRERTDPFNLSNSISTAVKNIQTMSCSTITNRAEI